MEKTKTVEVLITTMHLDNPKELLTKMNIQGCAMIGNQTNYDKVEDFLENNHRYKIYSFNEKGVGLNRNNLLMRSQADYCLFGDDDLIYVDNYEKIVIQEFTNHPDADILIFNLEETNPKRFITKQEFKVGHLNYMRFGAARIAIRLSSIKLNGILFNTSFGGGTPHSNGEDTLFLSDCINKKLRIYAVPITIATLEDSRESTWFKGYDDKYFKDKGILYYIISKKLYKLYILQDALRHHKLYSKSIKYITKTMLKGACDENQKSKI